ncbi:MAG TPA: IS1182 family transposase [Vicinamibacteria bacterium]
MSLQPQVVYVVPEDTARVARAAFPKGNAYLRMHDELGRLYADRDFAALFPALGQPALAPAQLALVTLMQCAEGLSDRQAADAVRARIDWKYALCLPLEDPGFDHSVLSEFRARLLVGGQEALLFEQLLARCREARLVRARGRQRSDSTAVLAAIRQLNRLALVDEALRHALHALAAVVPDWVRRQCPADWPERYGPRLGDYRLPLDLAARQALAAQIGADGRALLRAVYAPGAPAWLRELPAVEALRRIWVQQYHAPDQAGAVRWRDDRDRPPGARRIVSPHDPEARHGTKRETSWTGYKVHLTETCDADGPHLITDVQTTAATTPDHRVTATIHTALAAAGLLPREHLVDAGYVDAANLVRAAREHQVELVGPALGDSGWQAHTPGAFTADCFAIDWAARQASCPQGHASAKWVETHDPDGNADIVVSFAPAACLACPCRARCTRSARGPRRLTLQPQAQHLALRAARARQRAPDFAARYAARAGVEGTIAQGVRNCDLRHARYRGLAKTRLQHLLTGAAINLARLAAWFAERPLAATRPSRLAALAA